MSIRGFLIGVVVVGAFSLALIADAKIAARAQVPVSVPQMERAGEVMFGRDRVYLWEFNYKGRTCLWATSQGGHPRGGLTCWKED